MFIRKMHLSELSKHCLCACERISENLMRHVYTFLFVQRVGQRWCREAAPPTPQTILFADETLNSGTVWRGMKRELLSWRGHVAMCRLWSCCHSFCLLSLPLESHVWWSESCCLPGPGRPSTVQVQLSNGIWRSRSLGFKFWFSDWKKGLVDYS